MQEMVRIQGRKRTVIARLLADTALGSLVRLRALRKAMPPSPAARARAEIERRLHDHTPAWYWEMLARVGLCKEETNVDSGENALQDDVVGS